MKGTGVRMKGTGGAHERYTGGTHKMHAGCA